MSKSYLKHAAIWVKDIHWQIKFFHDVLGRAMREVRRTPDVLLRYWSLALVVNPRAAT